MAWWDKRIFFAVDQEQRTFEVGKCAFIVVMFVKIIENFGQTSQFLICQILDWGEWAYKYQPSWSKLADKIAGWASSNWSSKKVNVFLLKTKTTFRLRSGDMLVNDLVNQLNIFRRRWQPFFRIFHASLNSVHEKSVARELNCKDRYLQLLPEVVQIREEHWHFFSVTMENN